MSLFHINQLERRQLLRNTPSEALSLTGGRRLSIRNYARSSSVLYGRCVLRMEVRYLLSFRKLQMLQSASCNYVRLTHWGDVVSGQVTRICAFRLSPTTWELWLGISPAMCLMRQTPYVGNTFARAASNQRRAASWLRRLVVGLSPQRPVLSPRRDGDSATETECSPSEFFLFIWGYFGFSLSLSFQRHSSLIY